MPTYQYACTDEHCGLRFERVQAFSDEAISNCPDCTQRVRKVYGSVGVVFKGSGFYRNDSRAGTTAKSAAGSESSDTSKSDKGTDKVTAEKPATSKSNGDSAGGAGSPAKTGSSDAKASAPVAS